MNNNKTRNLHALIHLLITSFFLAVFHLFAPQSYAVQPATGSWTLVGLSDKFVRSIAVDPTDPNILYVGTEWNGVVPGVFKSTDGGEAWTEITNGLPVSQPHISYRSLAIDPSNPNVLYVGVAGDSLDGQSFEGMFKSTNGGAGWVVIE